MKTFAQPMPRATQANKIIYSVISLMACATLVGCGGGQSASSQVRQTLRRFVNDVSTRNYRELCTTLLASNLTDKLAEIGLPCESAMARGLGGVHNPTLSVLDVDVHGRSATAVVRASASNQGSSKVTLELLQVGGQWRISSLGPAR